MEMLEDFLLTIEMRRQRRNLRLLPVILETLTCVSSGTGPEKPNQRSDSDKFRRFASGIRSRYEFVVIDSPPLLPYADARFLAALADGAVLVGYAV